MDFERTTTMASKLSISSSPTGFQLGRMPSAAEMASVTAAAQRARARAMAVYARALRRALGRGARAIAHWVRLRLDEPAPLSPWMRGRL
jgi:uncharacterized protein with beta-barrel porin domain